MKFKKGDMVKTEPVSYLDKILDEIIATRTDLGHHHNFIGVASWANLIISFVTLCLLFWHIW